MAFTAAFSGSSSTQADKSRRCASKILQGKGRLHCRKWVLHHMPKQSTTTAWSSFDLVLSTLSCETSDTLGKVLLQGRLIEKACSLQAPWVSNRLYAGSYLYNLLHDGPLINRVCTKFTPSVDLPSLSAHNLPLCKERGRTCSDLVTPGSAVAEALSECKLTETITIQDATQGRCKSSRCTIQGTLHPQHCPHQIL